MAKIGNGYMGGFSGSLGPAVGYQWNGKWCLRSKPAMVRNPRTVKQMEHRALFRQQVRLAAQMRWAVTTALTDVARESGMTSYNLFVSLNQQAFSQVEGELAVDWSLLQLSVGPVAPVSLEGAALSAGDRLEVDFERNPMHLSSSAFDQVWLYIFSPALGQGFLTTPVYRRERRIGVVLPTGFADGELHLYAFVGDRQGRFSPTAYLHFAPEEPDAAAAPQNTDNHDVTADIPAASDTQPAVGEPDTAPVAADAAPTPREPDDPAQLSLW